MIDTPQGRWRVIEQLGRKCVWCGATKDLHIDHIVPQSRGGKTEIENFQVLCAACNTKKGNRFAVRFVGGVAYPLTEADAVALKRLSEPWRRVGLDLRPDLYERLRTLAFKRHARMNTIGNELFDRFLSVLEEEYEEGALPSPGQPAPATQEELESSPNIVYTHGQRTGGDTIHEGAQSDGEER